MTPGNGKLHVLMLLDSSYPPAQGGGTELQVRTLAKGLRAQGHRVTVFAPVVPPAGRGLVARVDRIPVFRLPFPAIRFLGGLWLMARLYMFLLSRRGRYDVWHVHSPRRLGAVAALLGGRASGPQVVVKVASAYELTHGTLSPRPGWIGRFQYFCLKRANAWQAISQQIAMGIAARGIPETRIAAIPNAVDLGRFSPAVAVERDEVRFLFVGRLVQAKNLFRLLDAFARVVAIHSHARLRLVGGGPLDAELREHAARLGLDGHVEFLGHRTDVEALLRDADVGVLPSTVEGLSNTLLECMASGLPMIASRISGSEDLVRPGVNGWLFDPRDVDGLAACLAEAASLPRAELEALGRQGRLTVENYASLDSVLHRILGLYRGAPAPDTVAATAVHEGA